MEWSTTPTGIQGEIVFENQTELATFVLKLAKVSDTMQHHADLDIRYNRLKMNIFTHDENAVTEKDRLLCQQIEKLMD
ncbi:MAG: 4a-hydroxytetrahydrobiopterin dehydratase [Crocinitomicaceae bacterium]